MALRGLVSLSLALVPFLGAAGSVEAAEGPWPETGADLKLDKRVDPKRTTTDNLVTYTYTVTNRGPETAENTVLTDHVQPFISNIDTSPSPQCVTITVAGTGLFRCPLGDLAPGATVTLKISVAYRDPGTYTNSASVASDTPDPDIRNNKDKVKVVVGGADLKLRKTVSPTSTTAGSEVTYTYTVTNKGPSTAQFVLLTDTLPEGAVQTGLVFPPGWDCIFDAPTRTLQCDVDSLAAGATATVLLTVRYDAPGTYRNAAEVFVFTADPNTADNRDQATVTVS
ncbi:DUF11 domain-containing protein [Streptomyces sp. NPDC000410]|uniref:DUF11 domain-containing protein n=1 Tax=Streptomyces sp. NPDC000410 TaxID=3154254 RepID=UPI003318C140